MQLHSADGAAGPSLTIALDGTGGGRRTIALDPLAAGVWRATGTITLDDEVLRGHRQVNPLSVKLPTGATLTTADLAGFAKARDSVIALYSELPSVTRVAAATK